ncbi:Ubiquinone biosynthesis O-methyltransferase [Calidithermus terrae]|uniref:Ubiquinone biosynthesis O-methyltransferase n=2 Tax=Calidithermus terrae TaxID=1408545 RepID=A0A399EKL3_9DEIN|nr:Ubiquinone biosynthesis O-methyltransferase [Calidithermus terrae]
MKEPYDNEGIRVVEAPNCYQCGRQGSSLYRGLRDRVFTAPGLWNIAYCSHCQLAWLDPHPVPEDIGKLYTNYYTHVESERTPNKRSLLQRIRNSILAASFGYGSLIDEKSKDALLGRILSRVRLLYDFAGSSVMWLPLQKGGRLLDVGCGSGDFMARMRDLGWQVAGVEPDPTAAQLAQQRGLEVHQGTLEEAGLAEESFDVVTLNHVIEHLPDPISVLQTCRRLLREGGKIVIATPNSRSLGSRYFGQAWLDWDPPRHLYLFTRYSLGECVHRSGLCPLEVRTVAHSAWWRFVTSKLIRQNSALPGGLPIGELLRVKGANAGSRLQGLVFQLLEQSLLRTGDLGEELVLIAGKQR